MDSKPEYDRNFDQDTKIAVVDDSTKDEKQEEGGCKNRPAGYEYKSAATIFGWPLLHIAFGRDERGRLRVAKGVFAIGQFAIGLVGVFSQVGIGLVGVSQFLLCLCGIGQFIACLLGVGQFIVGLHVIGKFAAGLNT